MHFTAFLRTCTDPAFYAMDEAIRQDHLDFLSGGKLSNVIYRRIFKLELSLFWFFHNFS